MGDVMVGNGERLLLWAVYGDRICGISGLYLWPNFRGDGLVRNVVRREWGFVCVCWSL